MKKSFEFGISDHHSIGMEKHLSATMGFKVNLLIEQFGPDGHPIKSTLLHNEVKNGAIYGTMDQLLGSPSLSKPTHMELGTGTGGTTKLNSYIADSRTVFDSKTRNNAIVTIVCTFGAGVGTGTVTEAGIFDSATQDAGVLWLYADDFTHTKGALDTIVFTWTFTGSAV